MKKLLLHTCCAPCAIYVVQELSKEYDLSLYYFNSNIHPATEYEKRLQEIITWAKNKDIGLIEADYNPQEWFAVVKDLEEEPEGGSRCLECFQYRLGATAKYAKEHNYDLFSTTLSISPHKDAEAINRIGSTLGQTNKIEFLEADWKKNDGFKIACQLSKQESFYRQDYCGCVYSLKVKSKKSKVK
ncbi:MAG: recombinase [Candidatus Komeilibacteria bacterium CG_4_9_14_0_8_um_filter_36_9]|uniref:Epoxyqueuosine reductase QueH n=1 Tax=Candidatus Komeilibacteria bacterium CG_4_9_14_0_8_um_filter_36_9 TaxID=1974473 RepID=A0A2M8DR35_9BACT|nr:MAG: recombinase [Candidatus Komeilibacteria bacterium CG_4_9_14_0_8_um_filter_36_9]